MGKDIIKIASNFSVSATQYANQGNNIFGIRGFGKTYLAEKIAEGLLDARIPIIVFDPMGVWKNLKVGTGKNKGYEIVVAGGREPDLPLTESSAPDIVRAALKENISLVIDLYSKETASKSTWIRIVQKVIEIILYENEDTGTLRHIILEEAHQFIPQVLQKQHNLIFSEFEKLALMGRNALLGYTLLSQRAEQVNKSITENSELNFVLNQGGKNSLQSYKKWLDLRQEDIKGNMMKSLPKLQPGEAWVFGVMEQPKLIKILPKKTFHPNTREKQRPVELKNNTVDVTKFVAKLKKNLEEDKSKGIVPGPDKKKQDLNPYSSSSIVPLTNDKSLTEKQVETMITGVKKQYDTKILELNKQYKAQVVKWNDHHKRVTGHYAGIIGKYTNGLVKIHSIVDELKAIDKDYIISVPVDLEVKDVSISLPAFPFAETGAQGQMYTGNTNKRNNSSKLSPSWLRMLQAVKKFHPNPVSKEKISFWADVPLKVSTFKNGLAYLNTSGLIRNGNDGISITPEGINAAGEVDSLPKSREEMLDMWFTKLGPSCSNMLKSVLRAWPGDIHKTHISEMSGVSMSVSTFKNGMARLRTLKLIQEAGKDRYRIGEELVK